MSTRCSGRSCVRSSSSSSCSSTSTRIKKQKSRKQKEAEEEELDEDADADTMKSTTSCKFRIPRKRDLSPLKYLKNLGGKMVVGVLKMISPRRASLKVTSSERVKTSVAPLDSHRAEAIDDCIEFINSSSLPRSNSTSQ